MKFYLQTFCGEWKENCSHMDVQTHGVNYLLPLVSKFNSIHFYLFEQFFKEFLWLHYLRMKILPIKKIFKWKYMTVTSHPTIISKVTIVDKYWIHSIISVTYKSYVLRSLFTKISFSNYWFQKHVVKFI